MSKFRPICVPCRREMRCKKNDYLFAPDESCVWAGDMYECDDCGAQVVTGFGRDAVAWEHQESFHAYRAQCAFEVARGLKATRECNDD